MGEMRRKNVAVVEVAIMIHRTDKQILVVATFHQRLPIPATLHQRNLVAATFHQRLPIAATLHQRILIAATFHQRLPIPATLHQLFTRQVRLPILLHLDGQSLPIRTPQRYLMYWKRMKRILNQNGNDGLDMIRIHPINLTCTLNKPITLFMDE